MPTTRRANGGTVTRAELGAHLERIDAQLSAIQAKVDEIAASLAAPRRWFNARLTAVLDRSLIIVTTAVLAYIATHS